MERKKGIMKKIMTFVLVILLGGFLTNTGRTKARDIKAAVIAPDKNGALNKEAIMVKAASIAVPFVKNVGQFNAQVKYAADLFAGRFFLTGKELVYSLRQRGKTSHVQPGKRSLMAEAKKRSAPGKGIVFREYFVDKKGAKIDFKSKGERQSETVVSYFKGKDPKKWYSGVASYQSVSLDQVYPGVKVKLKASGKNVEKIFYVSPQSNLAEIKIGVEGVAGLKIDEDGRLLIKNTLGELAMRAPVAWQEVAGRRHEVKVGYRLLGKHLYGFASLEDYDKNLLLIIDPDLDTLMASTYLGGNDGDVGSSFALDSLGNVYVAGYTYSSDFPTTPGAYDRNYNAYYPTNNDAFISKFNNSLTRLLASTYFGGSYGDSISCLALDSFGNIYVAGDTNSDDFPTTPGVYDGFFTGYCKDFVSKLDSGLTTLLASTYLGGNFIDESSSLALDSAANVYVTGLTDSDDFPTTPEAYNRRFNNDCSICGIVFISKFDSNLTTLLASTFLSQGGYDGMPSLALDRAGNVYLTGMTFLEEFPTTPGAYDRIKNGYASVFVSKLNSDLTELLASTFLDGSGWNRSRSLVLDNLGNVFVTGDTDSHDFPTTPGAYDRTYNGGYNVFVSNLNSSLTRLLASTYLGGGYSDGYSLALDSLGNVYVTGETGSADFPTTAGAYNQKINGADAFISKLNSSLTRLLASTFLGGSDTVFGDCSYSLALDNLGNVFVIGETWSTDFPITPGAYQAHSGGWVDVFVSKLHNSLSKAITVTSPNGRESWMVGTSHNITWKSTGKIAKVRIEVSTNIGSSWNDVIAATVNDGSYAWTIPNTPSLQCLVRISDVANTSNWDISNDVFSILINLDLQAERREARAFSIVRQYGQIQFLAGNGSEPVAQYKIMRRQGSNEFILLRAIAPSDLQDNQFQMQDKYLEKDITYTYRVEAYDAAAQLIGISSEKTI